MPSLIEKIVDGFPFPMIDPIIGTGNPSTIFSINDGILGGGYNVINNWQCKCRE